jgi:hypothetical protein
MITLFDLANWPESVYWLARYTVVIPLLLMTQTTGRLRVTANRMSSLVSLHEPLVRFFRFVGAYNGELMMKQNILHQIRH